MTVSVTGLVCLKPSAFGRRCYRMRTHIGHEGRSGRVIRSGAALVASAGGFVSTLENAPLLCNRKNPLLTGLLSSGPNLRAGLLAAVQSHLPASASAAGNR